MCPRKSTEQHAAAGDGTGSSLIGRFATALARTRAALVGGIAELFDRSAIVDQVLLEDLENLLLSADVGVAATQRLIDGLSSRHRRRELVDSAAVLAALRGDMLAILSGVAETRPIPTPGVGTCVILMVGVNGTGKTTTIGKLAHRLKSLGHSVVLGAGDTFRAAAIEQLQVWGARIQTTVVAQHTGADSASVIFDALRSAQAKGADVLIADTAGRLHTQTGLMDELKKVKRVMSKLDAAAPHEVLLVVDAGTGQNALAQAREFDAAVALTGLVLTKLDGTARGGVVLAIAEQLGFPIRYIGTGEGISDLREFDASEFVDDLLRM